MTCTTPSTTPHTILLVSHPGDEPGRVSAALTERGFTVVLARDGDEALSRFVDHRVDAVLVCAAMPADAEYRWPPRIS